MYLLNMSFISSDKVRRINAFTILTLLPRLPVDLAVKYFEELMRHVVFETKSDKLRQDTPVQKKTSIFKDFETFSRRKGALREKQLYNDVRLADYFRRQMTVA